MALKVKAVETRRHRTSRSSGLSCHQKKSFVFFGISLTSLYLCNIKTINADEEDL